MHRSSPSCNSTPEASKLVPLSACIDTFAESEGLKVRELGSRSKFDDRGLDAQILGSIRFGLNKHTIFICFEEALSALRCCRPCN